MQRQKLSLAKRKHITKNVANCWIIKRLKASLHSLKDFCLKFRIPIQISFTQFITFANQKWMLYVGRITTGLGIGISSLIVPVSIYFTVKGKVHFLCIINEKCVITPRQTGSSTTTFFHLVVEKVSFCK